MGHIGAYYSKFRNQTIRVNYLGGTSYEVSGEGFKTFTCSQNYLISDILGYNKYRKIED